VEKTFFPDSITFPWEKCGNLSLLQKALDFWGESKKKIVVSIAAIHTTTTKW
jgi:hypothetical protein